jgi:SNF2 family DNA or RNA helicase
MLNDLVPKALAERMQVWRATAKPWNPWPYQERALKALLENGQYGLLLSPGMGKTAVVLAAVKVLLKKKLIKRALVVAPLRPVYAVWPAEVCEWADFSSLKIAILHGSGKDKVLRELRPEHQICLINPEGFQWLTSDKKRMKLLGADMLVIDESSLWKSGVSQRFRCLRPHLAEFKRRVILTGSPRPRHYLDLWAQIYLLDQGASLGKWISHYRNQFFFQTGYGGYTWEILPGAAEQINALVAPFVLRLAADDYLKLPKVLEREHRIELPPAARKEYDAIEDTFMSTLFTAPLTTSAAARSKLCQICNGAVYVDAGPQDERWPTKARPVKVVHTAKIEALVDLCNELQGEPILVAIGFKHDVDAIRRALGKDVPCINGDTTKLQAADYIDRWNKGLLPVLLGQHAAMSHGLNLQKFNPRHVCYFDVPDSYDSYDQFFQRVRRQGNKAEFVMKHHLVVQDTVDVVKMRNLRNKCTGQTAFLDAMRSYAEERGYKVSKKEGSKYA